MRFLTILLVLAASPQDELTLERLLERMDAAAPRGISLVLRGSGGATECQVHVARDGAARAHGGWRGRELTLASEALYFIEREDGPLGQVTASGLRAVTERLVPPTVGENPLDYYFEGLLLRTVVPRRALAFERDLRLAGRRRLEGEEFYLLVSRPVLNLWLMPVN